MLAPAPKVCESCGVEYLPEEGRLHVCEGAEAPVDIPDAVRKRHNMPKTPKKGHKYG